MEEKTLQVPVTPQVDDPARNGEDRGAKLPAESRTQRRKLPWRILLPILLLFAAGASLVGYNYFEDQANYVSTDNAQIAGSLVQVGSMNAGQVDSLNVDVGDSVEKDQVIGTVLLPSTMSMSQSGTPRLGFVGGENQRAEVRAPIAGVVVARQANVGDSVAVGQPMVTIVDPGKLWVQAQIEETKVGRVKVGQPVDVKVDSLGKTIQGKVTAVNRASSATFSLLPSSNATGNFTKVTQLVPVKIALDYGDLPLVLGSSVEVHIRVQE
ncbi:MAG: HlyD family efflux transporter periplasmic adaptor subunit [Chloroflexi bacterium]|nr:HlyD family efflux transporter periplasmic adaptor subunit [Chloroflexota bacterium]